MIKPIVLSLCSIVFYFAAYAQSTQPLVEKIHVGPGTEDIVLDTLNGQTRLLVSCNQRRKDSPHFGEIVAVGLKNHHAKDTLVRTNEPADLTFNPHGIDLVKGNDGKVWLFVVNHEEIEGQKTKRNSILVYEVQGKNLHFQKQHVSKYIVSPNDVAGLPDGGFYATNDSKRNKIGFGWLMEKMFQVRTSRIVYCPANGECFYANDKKVAYANGILVQGNRVYVAATQKKTLAEYSREADGSLKYIRNIAKLKGLDNISLVNDGHVLIAAHPSSGKFLKHARNAEKLSQGVVYLVKLENGKTEEPYANDGSAISGNSVAVGYGESLYIGQVFEDWILRVAVPNQ